MKRRKSLKALAAASVGVLAIGYWAKDLDEVRDFLSSSFFKPTEQDAIMAVVDTIIPRGEQAYGAVDLGVPIYILDYLQYCVEPKELSEIRKQLLSLDVKSNELHNIDFEACTQIEREAILIELSKSEIEEEQDFFNLMKEQTIHGFRNTEEVLTNHFDYTIIPGEFNGCIDVQAETVI